MLKAVVVDDERPIVNLLKMLIEKTEQVKVVKTFTEPLEAMGNICNIKPDIVFLDIEMPEVSGLELAGHLLEQDDDLMIVFVTGYNHYALEAFQVNALDYILKPMNQSTVTKCISRLIKLKGLDNDVKPQVTEKRIRCFGEFGVYGKSGLVNFPTRKVEEMLAYFVVNRDVNIDAWQLGENLWREEAPEKVKANLHTALFRLRKIINEESLPIEIHSIKGGKGVYRSSLDKLNCDLKTFEDGLAPISAVDKSNIDKWVAICALYRDGLFPKKCYEWCESKREELQMNYLNTLRKIAFYYIAEEMYQEAIDELLAAGRTAPFDEVIQRDLMKAYAAQNNRAMVIRCYEQFSKKLIEEIGVYPQAETKSLYLQLIDI